MRAHTISDVDGLFGCTADGESEEEADADLGRRAWWRGHSGKTTYEGWDASEEMLARLWERERFDGILGFSQGAAAAAMLCANVEHPRPKFAMIVSGFVPRDEKAAERLLAGVKDVPSLHVFGQTDQLVVPERSRALTTLFADATVVAHDGGHMIPSGAAVRRHVVSFLGSLE